VELAIGSAALKAALAAAKQLPKLTRSGRVAAEPRLAAYQRFSRAIWAVTESDSSSRAIQPIASKVLGGFWYHPMFVRTVERAMKSHGELLGAYCGLRLVAPNAIVDAAEKAADGVAELAATPVGDFSQHAKCQGAIGSAMIAFDLLCRIDLGIDRHPRAPKLSLVQLNLMVQAASLATACTPR
jgi:hypothetical protein